MVKATGITRRIDELGRIVLPIELRRTMGFEAETSIEIFVSDDGFVMLRRYDTAVSIQSDIERIAEKAMEELPEDKAKRVRDLIMQLGEVLKGDPKKPR